ncbi:hypothetical protein Hanom_Chr00s053401g01781081 [Helianthus anomalus]
MESIPKSLFLWQSKARSTMTKQFYLCYFYSSLCLLLGKVRFRFSLVY